MTGISILIVDDDKLLVEKLEKTVDWERLNIATVFTAYNIRQARSLMEEYPVHILLCDIDMPQGNGLELLEWVRAKELDIECMFLSSYANFAYAHSQRLSAEADFQYGSGTRSGENCRYCAEKAKSGGYTDSQSAHENVGKSVAAPCAGGYLHP